MEIARGVEHMHKLNLIHGNLKSVRFFHYRPFCHGLTFPQTNILIDPEGHARIAGLGVALISSPIPGVDIDRFFHGAAPELVDAQHVGPSNTGATKASDMYAFAVLAWEVSMGFVARLR